MSIKLISALCKDDFSEPVQMAADTVLTSNEQDFSVGPGETKTVTVSYVHNTVPPDRGRLTINVSNAVAPA